MRARRSITDTDDAMDINIWPLIDMRTGVDGLVGSL